MILGQSSFCPTLTNLLAKVCDTRAVQKEVLDGASQTTPSNHRTRDQILYETGDFIICLDCWIVGLFVCLKAPELLTCDAIPPLFAFAH